MADLTADKVRTYQPTPDPDFIEVSVKASTTLYKGQALEDDSGNGVADALTGGGTFIGFAEAKCDNSAGAAGDKRVRVRTRGIVRDLAVTGISAVTDFGITVYATADNTFTTNGSGASSIGKVVRYVASGYADVEFEGATARSL